MVVIITGIFEGLLVIAVCIDFEDESILGEDVGEEGLIKGVKRIIECILSL